MSRIEQCPFTRRGFLAAAGLAATAEAARGAAGPPREGAPALRSEVVQEGGGQTTYLLVFDKGAEVMSGLLAFAKKHRLVGGQISAIGAVSSAVLGFFDRKQKDYKRIPLKEQAEVVSLTGNVALKGGGPFLHVHAVLGLPDGSTRGGHLFEAHVWPTLEVVLTSWARPARRTRDRETGLYLLGP